MPLIVENRTCRYFCRHSSINSCTGPTVVAGRPPFEYLGINPSIPLCWNRRTHVSMARREYPTRSSNALRHSAVRRKGGTDNHSLTIFSLSSTAFSYFKGTWGNRLSAAVGGVLSAWRLPFE